MMETCQTKQKEPTAQINDNWNIKKKKNRNGL